MKINNKIIVICLHILLGALSTVSPYISAIWFYLFFLYSLFRIVSTSNEDDYASYAVLYIVTLEIVMRMNNSSLTLYETGKYSCCILFIFAMSVERRKNAVPQFAIVYLICLLPSLFVGHYSGAFDVIDCFSFNLSGPIVLALSCMYFYKRKVDKERFEKMVYYFILPIIAACIVVIIKLPTFKEITFSTDSNKQLSGGFGPNQAATIFGFGFAILTVSWLLKAKITSYHWLDLVVGMVFLGFALLTFSRGGVVSAFLSIISALFVLMRTGQNIKAVKQIIYLLIVLAVFGTVMWNFMDNFTGGFLSLRYEKTIDIAQEHTANETLINTTGRTEIANIDIGIFLKNPIFGIGPGKSINIHGDKLGERYAAHTEFTRLLAEHGFFGLICVLVLFIAPILVFNEQTPEGKTIMAAMVVLTLSTMSHGAMRLAVGGLAFGIGFAYFDFKSFNPLIRGSDT